MDILKIGNILSGGNKLIDRPKKVYRNVYEFIPNVSRLWYPQKFNSLNLKRDQIIGEIRSYDNKLIEIVKSPYDGEMLYFTQGLLCEKGSVLFGMGYEEVFDKRHIS